LIAAVSNADGDVDNTQLSFGQDAGLIDSIASVREVAQKIVADAEGVIKGRLESLLT
jgi:NAD(P)H-dependent flavin oxidoreductase YrpB (nitropropane dioxygenase family)